VSDGRLVATGEDALVTVGTDEVRCGIDGVPAPGHRVDNRA